MLKRALITGITGQDGSYLADFLLKKGYEVHGIVRRASTFNRERINHLSEEGSYTSDSEKKHFYTHYGDLTDSASIEKILLKIMPDEIYNLAAQSHVGISFEVPENTSDVVALGTLRLLEGIRKICPKARFYQASSSEMFGKAVECPQTEKTPFYPRSPYACAKVYAFHIVVNYREAYGLYASNGILFNHEGERRGESFVTRKITMSLTRIKFGLQYKLVLGNLDAQRDWGYAPEYVEAMWKILQRDAPNDYVIGTGEKHSVREFLEEVARLLGLNIKSNGKKGIEEKYLDETGKVIVEISPSYFRPTEVDVLQADSSKAKREIGWEPKTKFKEIVRLMVMHDLKLAENEAILKKRVHKEIPIKEIAKCRICGNTELISVLNLGIQELSGRFPLKDEECSIKSPLELVKCNDLSNKNACGLLQLKHTVELVEMYGEEYGYRSGLNSTMTSHLINIANVAESLVELNKGDVVLDIGSSDATLLKAYKSKIIDTIGIDPIAKKFLEYYTENIKLVTDFFSAEKYKSLYPDKKAKIITSIAMFYDLEEPMKFIKDIKEILHNDGIWILEQSYMPRMLEVNSFDTICQEHLEYYSFKQIEWMLERNELKAFDVELNDINGGSFRIYVCHKNNPRETNIERIEEIRKYEKSLELETLNPYEDFKNRVIEIKKSLLNFLFAEKSKGKRIHLYGASTKGNILLQFFGIGKDIIEAAADRNPDKWKRKTPGTNIPIISEEDSRKLNPDYYLVLPWHFRKEFIEREQEFLRKGGKMIFPLPKPEIVSAENIGLKLNCISIENFLA